MEGHFLKNILQKVLLTPQTVIEQKKNKGPFDSAPRAAVSIAVLERAAAAT